MGVGGIGVGWGGVGSTNVGHRTLVHAVGGKVAGSVHGGSPNPASVSSVVPMPTTLVSSALNVGAASSLRWPN